MLSNPTWLLGITGLDCDDMTFAAAIVSWYFLSCLRDLSIALVRRHEEEKQLESFTTKVWKRGLELELELLKIGRASTTNMGLAG